MMGQQFTDVRQHLARPPVIRTDGHCKDTSRHGSRDQDRTELPETLDATYRGHQLYVARAHSACKVENQEDDTGNCTCKRRVS
jgi:hypothetical protein